jgi:hypothetical protein
MCLKGFAAEIDAFWRAAKRPAFPALHSQAFKAPLLQMFTEAQLFLT